MLSLRHLLLPLLLSPCGFAVAFAASPPPELPVEHFFRNPAITQLRFSPNGRYIAALVPYERRLNLVIMDWEAKTKNLITAFKDFSISSYRWANDDRLVMLLDDDGDEDFLPFAIDRDGKNFIKFDDTKGFTDISRRDPKNPRRVLVYSNQTHRDRIDPCWLDVKTGKVTVIAANPGDVQSWVLDWNHVARFAIESRSLESTVLYRDKAGGDWKTLATFQDGQPQWRPLGFAGDNRTVFIASNEGRKTYAIYKYDTATLQRGELVFADPEDRYDVTALIASDDDSRVAGVRYTTDRVVEHYWDETVARRQRILDEALPGLINQQQVISEDGKRVLVQSRSDREPGVYYLFDEAKKKIEELAVLRPHLDPSQLAPMKAIRYKARDGLEIEAMLTLPVGREPKKLPLVINPHGGPFGPRDEWRYNPEIQLLANRGFAIIQPNYRGSGGYGDWFERLGYRQWGRAMQDDLTDAVKWAVETGLADPARVVILGASYGGYAVMAGLTFTPELYAAGVNYVGVTDLKLIASQRRSTEGRKAWTKTRIGDLFEDSDELYTRSPVNFAQLIRVPVIMAYGQSDPRVTREHGDDMRSALAKHNKDFEFIIESGEGHGFRKEENAIAFYTRVDDFLKKHVLTRRTEAQIGPSKVIELPAKSSQ